MFRTMLRRLARRPFSLAIVGVLVGVPIAGGTAMLVSEDFRQEVEARVASALPGTVIGGCEIKPRTQCPNADLHGADLSGARLIGANLSGADLRRAYLWEANLSGANLSEALFFHTRMPDGSIRNQ